MFIKHILLDQDSLIEVSTRLIAGETKVVISIRGKKNEQEITVASAVLNSTEAQQIAEIMQQAAQYKTSIE
jgi:hypothetical protein